MTITSNTNIHQSSFLNNPKVPKRSQRKRALSELYEFEVCTNRDKFKDFTSLASEQTPFCYHFKRQRQSSMMTKFNITIQLFHDEGQSYRDQSINFLRKSMGCFLYDNGPVLKELSFDTKSGALAVREYIAIDTSLHISLPMIDMLFH